MTRAPKLVIFLLLMALAPVASAARVVVTMSGLRFSPAIVTINVGDTVEFINQGGFHDAVADDGSFTSGSPRNAPWTFEHVFNTPGTFGYYCTVHGSPGVGMAGTIVVQQVASTFVINEGLQGAWFNPATSGQGNFFDIFPGSRTFSMAWFTWTGVAGQYDWYTGAGTWTGERATLQLFRSRGGRFNDPTPVATTAAGTATITFSSCTAATMSWTLTDPASSGSVPLQRILPASPVCVTANPGTP